MVVPACNHTNNGGVFHNSHEQYLGVTLTKEVKDLYDKHFKSLKKQVLGDLRRWEDLPCLWIGRINIVKNGHLAKSNLQIQCNPHQNSNSILHRVRASLKFIWNNKKKQNSEHYSQQ